MGINNEGDHLAAHTRLILSRKYQIWVIFMYVSIFKSKKSALCVYRWSSYEVCTQNYYATVQVSLFL